MNPLRFIFVYLTFDKLNVKIENTYLQSIDPLIDINIFFQLL